MAKTEGRIAGFIRLYFESPRTDDEAVAYLQGWADAARNLAEIIAAHRQEMKP